jgi:hypothetical protein
MPGNIIFEDCCGGRVKRLRPAGKFEKALVIIEHGIGLRA